MKTRPRKSRNEKEITNPMVSSKIVSLISSWRVPLASLTVFDKPESRLPQNQ